MTIVIMSPYHVHFVLLLTLTCIRLQFCLIPAWKDCIFMLCRKQEKHDVFYSHICKDLLSCFSQFDFAWRKSWARLLNLLPRLTGLYPDRPMVLPLKAGASVVRKTLLFSRWAFSGVPNWQSEKTAWKIPGFKSEPSTKAPLLSASELQLLPLHGGETKLSLPHMCFHVWAQKNWGAVQKPMPSPSFRGSCTEMFLMFFRELTFSMWIPVLLFLFLTFYLDHITAAFGLTGSYELKVLWSYK